MFRTEFLEISSDLSMNLNKCNTLLLRVMLKYNVKKVLFGLFA